MVIIKNLELKEKYRYVWLKYVTGVNLSEHCARSLIGKYDNRVKAGISKYNDLVLQKSPFYYFCTVNGYEKNIHIAFKEEQGSVIEIDNQYCRCTILNARRIDINTSYINYSLPQASKKEFYTCRNWQFANYLKRIGM